MLPSIRLVVVAIVASVVLMMGGFGLVATFQIAKTSIGAPPRGAPPPDPALADRPERNKVYASTGTPRINEEAPVADMPSRHTAVASPATNPAPAARYDKEDAVVGTPTNFGAASPPELASSSRSDDGGPDQISGIDARSERGPAVVALTEDESRAIENLNASADAATDPTASSDGRPVGTAIPVEANASATSSVPAAILSTPDVAAAPVAPSREHEAMETASPPRTAPEVGSSSTPAETTVAARRSHTAGETTAAGPRSTAETGPAPTPLSVAVEATIAPNAESPKATATKGKRATKTTKPHAPAKKAKEHQATMRKAKVWTAARVRRRSIHAATQSTGQPQNPANPFGNFFGSQQAGRWPSEIGAAR
jgi:hypothetical protein